MRVRTVAQHGIEGARIRPGREAEVLDASPGGVLVETLHRLLPGTTVELQLTLGDRCASVRGRVMRSTVACLRSGGILYRGALAFERPLAHLPALDGYAVPATAASEWRHGREDATRPTL
jgi:hypothetical protein